MGTYRKLSFDRIKKPPAHAYSILLAALVALWMVAPFLPMVNLEAIGSAFFITVTLVAASYAMSDQGKSFVVIIVLGVALGIMVWLDVGVASTHWITVATQAMGLLFFGVVAYELLVDILSKESRVDANLIAGAVAVYLLIGVCFSFIYDLMFSLDPGSFRGIAENAPAHPTFTYFSFVTITTLGYGDITPLTRIGGAFATLEAIIGQLYLTVLVARLVGMHISQGPQHQESGR